MDWIKDSRYTNVYYTTTKFNGFTYNVIYTLDENAKSVKYWISVSSGKKRKDFEIFEEKGNKSFGGIQALFWIKEAMFDFPKFFENKLYGRKAYICIGWVDSRRRDIYKRLEKDGFVYTMESGSKILMKQV